MRRWTLVLCGLVWTFVGGACSSATYNPYYYDTGYDDAAYVAYDSAMTYAWVDPIYGDYYVLAAALRNADVDVNAEATKLADAAGTYFTPSSCVTATAAGGTVSYTFNNCVGPAGVATISGDVTVTLSAASGQLGITSTSNNLTVNGVKYTLSLEVTGVAPTGNTRSVTVTSTGFSPDRTDRRTAQMTVSWTVNSGCVAVDGQDTQNRNNVMATATVAGFEQCTGHCPTAGTVTVTTASGNFEGAFDGTQTFTVTAPDKQTRTYKLSC